jgi:Tfp pilus assembly protein PilF
MRNILSILLRRHPTAPKARPMIVPAPETKKSRESTRKIQSIFLTLALILGATIAYLELVHYSGDTLMHGGSVDSHQHGIELLRNGNFVEATQYFRDTLKSEPKSVSLRINLAFGLKAQGKDSEAENLYRQILGEHPKNILALNNYGAFLFQKQRWAEAEMQFTKALTVDEKNLEATINLGIVQETANKYSAAIQSYDKALLLAGLTAERQKELSERVRLLQAIAFSKDNLGEKL